MFHAGVMATWATDWLGAENVRGFKIRWKEAVWPGDVLVFTGHVVRRYEEDGERRVEIVCAKEGGAVAAQATAVFVVVV